MEMIEPKVGAKIGRLSLIEEVMIPRKKSRTVRGYRCKCDCGRETTVSYYNLKYGVTKSCGCYQSDVTRAINTTHGMSKTRVFRIWSSMRKRCNNVDDISYNRYGGRGIKVCKRWDESFEAFYEDMGDPPSKDYSIDRIDNNGDYEPSNCRWATSTEQARNRRSSTHIQYAGDDKTIAEISESTGISYSLLQLRLNKYGWSIEEAVSIPSRKRRESCQCGGKSVLQFSLDGKFIKEWDSMSKAARSIGCGYKQISSCACGRQKSAHGFIWRKKDNEQ